ncbi:MAG TPA: hypothetical protein DCS66_14040 [Flavobacteriaceae bacterium]|nr:hypothetical protein [Flavobacteriaceae bacterium]|tara:strand:+ start:290 stop:502 length:213 start_codon:yes stop_codon:yes gene_type:complete
MGDNLVGLLEDFGDSVDIYYTQFLEVAFFLKVPATEKMAVAFVKRKLPGLSEDEIRFLIKEIVDGYYDTL